MSRCWKILINTYFDEQSLSFGIQTKENPMALTPEDISITAQGNEK